MKVDGYSVRYKRVSSTLVNQWKYFLPFKMMIVTLIPFILAAKLNFSPSRWRKGEKATVTYAIQDHVIKTYSAGSNNTDEIFQLNTLLTCQNIANRLHCYFHDVDVQTKFVDGSQGTKFLQDDTWLKDVLQQDKAVINTADDGFMYTLVTIEVEPAGRYIMEALINPLYIGLDMSEDLIGSYKIKSNITGGRCGTKYLVTRSPNLGEQKECDMELFFIAQPNETLDKPVRIIRFVEDKNCSELIHVHSPYAARELRKLNRKDIDIDMASMVSLATVTQCNYTSYTKNIFSISDRKENTKYVIDELLSLTLHQIDEIKCNEEVSPRECINERRKHESMSP